MNKIDELAALSFVHKPDFILIAEAWSNSSLNDAFFSLPAYELKSRNDRTDTTNGKGGGLLIYARSDIAGSVTEVELPLLDTFNQCCVVKLTLVDSKINIALVYRPHSIYEGTIPQPDKTAENNENLVSLLHDIPRPCVIAGDFNYSGIDWDVMSGGGASEKFLLAVQDNFLTQFLHPLFRHSARFSSIQLSRSDIRC